MTHASYAERQEDRCCIGPWLALVMLNFGPLTPHPRCSAWPPLLKAGPGRTTFTGLPGPYSRPRPTWCRRPSVRRLSSGWYALHATYWNTSGRSTRMVRASTVPRLFSDARGGHSWRWTTAEWLGRRPTECHRPGSALYSGQKCGRYCKPSRAQPEMQSCGVIASPWLTYSQGAGPMLSDRSAFRLAPGRPFLQQPMTNLRRTWHGCQLAHPSPTSGASASAMGGPFRRETGKATTWPTLSPSRQSNCTESRPQRGDS